MGLSEDCYICTDDPKSPFLKKFEKYNVIIHKHKNALIQYDPESGLDDFKFIMSFNRIIIAQSTFSWWAAFLSKANEIFIPITNQGNLSPHGALKIHNLKKPRYKYIKWSWPKTTTLFARQEGKSISIM